MRYSLAVFDLDGTLLDTLGDLTDALNFALDAEGFSVRSTDEVKAFVGNGIAKLIELSAPNNCPKKVLERLDVTFRQYYASHCADKTAPYTGIKEVLNDLRICGVKLAVVSNKADYAVQALVKKHFNDSFDYALGEVDGVLRKPAPDSLKNAISKMGAIKEKTVYIGDSEVDIQTAKNAGVDCISVSWGFRSKEQLEKSGASVIVSDATELKEKIVGQ